MPRLEVNGAELHYEETGSGPETVVFAHGLLWSGRMFAAQIAALAGRYRCLAFDFRGQGRSAVTRDGYDMETLSSDAAGLITRLAGGRCHFVGLSMGGFVGMRLAIERPELIASLVLLETSADPEPPASARKYRLLCLVARWIGLRAAAGPVEKVMFGRKFLHDPARAAERLEWRRALLANDRIGATRAAMGVIRRRPVYDRLERIRAPTLIVVGDQDVATVPAKSERVHARIVGSRLRVIPGAGHSSTIEEPAAVNAAIAEFLAEVGEGRGEDADRRGR